MSKKSFDPYKFRKQNKIQTGLGLYERFRGSYLIPVNPNSTQTESTLIQNKQVAPVEADAERAESELKENNINDNNYPWKAYLKTILSSGNDEQNSQLQSQLFMKDDDPRNPLSLNSGYVSRYESAKNQEYLS
ncbi:Hypothetical predicted protein [Mytilus galloprovincialis]|uniref:Uncharacterized protein n=1 Tax=Mytilus galloprovincialis TaxID=29158 RepID=A0A8B6ECJ4_MYTGA|nr:Hypothetical predicted protein [Mytilus galloprovincialis]